MRTITKKELALSLHASGRTVEEIARALETHPSYVANVLAAAGKTPDYADLYVQSSSQNGYAKVFQGILRFKDVETAKASVQSIDDLFHKYELERDRRGMHQAQLVALIGKNRAEGVAKYAEARVFGEWLIDHLDVHFLVPPEEDALGVEVGGQQPPAPEEDS